MPIRSALFDMDDVLCHYDVPRRVAALARAEGCSEAHVRAVIWDSGFLDETDLGRWDAAGTLAEFSRRLGADLSREAWVAARRQAMTPFPDVLALVSRLAGSVPVAILTNNDPLVQETIDQLFPQLRPLFGRRIFVSSQFRAAKPDPAVFHACCAAAGFVPEETFFTDDKPENVAGARSAGLTAHVFRNGAGLEAALRQAGLAV